MKKLMLGLFCAASVCALADGNTNDFENYTAGKQNLGACDDSGLDSGSMYFAYESVDGSSDCSTVKKYGVGENLPTFNYEGSVPNAFESATDNNQYLNVSTEGGTLWRGWASTSNPPEGSSDRVLGDGVNLSSGLEAGANVYVDMLVQFTPTEDGVPPEVTADDQMAIWLNVDSTNPEAPVTNLCVLAALVGKGTAESSVFTVPNKSAGGLDIKPGQWYRLTVKTFADITNGKYVPGFVVYIDGEIIKTGKSTFSTGYLAELKGSNSLAISEEEIANGSVFASLWTRPEANQNTKAPVFQAVGFNGEGAVDDLSLTTEVPNFIEIDSTFEFTLTWDDHVASVSYKIGEDKVDIEDLSTGSVTIRVEPDTVVTVAASAKDWYKVASGSGDVTVDEAKTVEITTSLVGTLADVGIDNLPGVSVEDAKEWVEAKELTPDDINACDFAMDAYLMNSDLSAKPELKIIDIREVEGGWMIMVKGNAGEADIDLGNLNGPLKVKSAATLDALKDAEGVAYDIDVRENGAAIKIAGDNKNFMQALVTP